MDLHIDKFCVGYIVRSLVNIGIERFKNSWNNHRIPKKGVPIELAEANSRIQNLNNDQIPSLEEAITSYNQFGSITSDYEYLNAFGGNQSLNETLKNHFENEKYRFNSLYSEILTDYFDVEHLYAIIQDHRRLFLEVGGN
jgi:hypothetical protein